MTAKEKAIEIFNNYFNAINIIDDVEFSKKLIRKLSIICVNEIINLECLTDEAWLNIPDEYKIQFWKQVIIEINLL
jgi:hypothetical protein